VVAIVREEEIRPADLLSAYLALSADDARSFFGNKSKLVARPCPGCGEDKAVPAFTKNGFDLSTCAGCGTLYVSPAPAAEDLAEFYRDSPSTRYWANVFFPAVAEARRERIFRPRAEKISSLLNGRGKRAIDVGAGSGLFLKEMMVVDPDIKTRAVEPGADLARICRAANIETFEGFAEDAANDSGWASWADLVTSFEVVEHVLNMTAFIRSLGALAKPGGIVLVTGLCGTGFDIKILGIRSNAVSPPHHLNFVSRVGMTALAARAGLELVDFSTPGQLDIDIVCNALANDPEAVTDPALRGKLLTADVDVRRRMQDQLVTDRRSSHMWALMRRPLQDAPRR
jgi:hypothetical protein